jgi:hypothetical protein
VFVDRRVSVVMRVAGSQKKVRGQTVTLLVRRFNELRPKCIRNCCGPCKRGSWGEYIDSCKPYLGVERQTARAETEWENWFCTERKAEAWPMEKKCAMANWQKKAV